MTAQHKDLQKAMKRLNKLFAKVNEKAQYLTHEMADYEVMSYPQKKAKALAAVDMLAPLLAILPAMIEYTYTASGASELLASRKRMVADLYLMRFADEEKFTLKPLFDAYVHAENDCVKFAKQFDNASAGYLHEVLTDIRDQLGDWLIDQKPKVYRQISEALNP